MKLFNRDLSIIGILTITDTIALITAYALDVF